MLEFDIAEIFEVVDHSALNTEVGTHYFFRGPLPLVRYFEIVFPLRAGPQLSKFGSQLPLFFQ
jgi:hypothetical protein